MNSDLSELNEATTSEQSKQNELYNLKLDELKRFLPRLERFLENKEGKSETELKKVQDNIDIINGKIKVPFESLLKFEQPYLRYIENQNKKANYNDNLQMSSSSQISHTQSFVNSILAPSTSSQIDRTLHQAIIDQETQTKMESTNNNKKLLNEINKMYEIIIEYKKAKIEQDRRLFSLEEKLSCLKELIIDDDNRNTITHNQTAEPETVNNNEQVENAITSALNMPISPVQPVQFSLSATSLIANQEILPQATEEPFEANSDESLVEHKTLTNIEIVTETAEDTYSRIVIDENGTAKNRLADLIKMNPLAANGYSSDESMDTDQTNSHNATIKQNTKSLSISLLRLDSTNLNTVLAQNKLKLAKRQSKVKKELDEDEREEQEIDNLCKLETSFLTRSKAKLSLEKSLDNQSSSDSERDESADRSSKNKSKNKSKKSSSSESDSSDTSSDSDVEMKQNAANHVIGEQNMSESKSAKQALLDLLKKSSYDSSLSGLTSNDESSDTSDTEAKNNKVKANKDKSDKPNEAESANSKNALQIGLSEFAIPRLDTSDDEKENEDQTKKKKSSNEDKDKAEIDEEAKSKSPKINGAKSGPKEDSSSDEESANNKTLVNEDKSDENKKDNDHNGMSDGVVSPKPTCSKYLDDDKMSNDEEDDEEIISKPRKEKHRIILSSSETNETDRESLSSDTNESNKKKHKKRLSTESENSSSDSTFKAKKSKRYKLASSDSQSSDDIQKKKKRKNKKNGKKNLDSDTESDTDDDVVELNEDDSFSKHEKTRHKLHKIIDDDKLNKDTQDALAAEKERKKRIEDKRKMEMENLGILKDLESTKLKELYLDIDSKTKMPLIPVDQSIVRHLKPHQIEGVKFMWDSCFEKVELIQKGHKGSGCMLAHCMGLGKTLQVITLVHTLLVHRKLTLVDRVLIIVPVNVLNNWKAEFAQWTEDCSQKVKVFTVATERGDTKQRVSELETWFEKGGVLLIGYTMFRQLVEPKKMKADKMKEKLKRFLAKPGANLIICDEGHMLKNETTKLSNCINQVETKRRIVLTGTPLQNNLTEYHCMVSFVKPNLLGSIKEFKNRFANPINNGQHKDSTEADVRIMKKRVHVLHNALDGCVQRKDYSYLKDFLPKKLEYVLSIRLSDKQVELYNFYLEKEGFTKPLEGVKIGGAKLFSDFQNLSRIWTHPWVMKLNECRLIRQEEKLEKKREEEAFIVASDASSDQDNRSDTSSDKKSPDSNEINDDDDEIIMQDADDQQASRKTPINGGGINKNGSSEQFNGQEQVTQRWWSDLIGSECEYDMGLSGKLVLLEKILKCCKEKGDKLLVFSQSLLSLDIIEKFLTIMRNSGNSSWVKNKDYYRMDGQTELSKRKSHIENFNDPANKKARLFLISTKSGGIGINLIGANRCIVFDATWNPSYDTQSIFRIYRIGQTKRVYVYRFLAQGTMEEKIYQRQVAKQSLSQRVIDEHQLDRHFTNKELSELYAFEPDIYDENSHEIPALPEDDLLRVLLTECKRWIKKYHEHDSLLENKVSEGLTEEERASAWKEYEAEKELEVQKANYIQNMSNFQNLQANIPNVTLFHQNGSLPLTDHLTAIANARQANENVNRTPMNQQIANVPYHVLAPNSIPRQAQQGQQNHQSHQSHQAHAQQSNNRHPQYHPQQSHNNMPNSYNHQYPYHQIQRQPPPVPQHQAQTNPNNRPAQYNQQPPQHVRQTNDITPVNQSNQRGTPSNQDRSSNQDRLKGIVNKLPVNAQNRINNQQMIANTSTPKKQNGNGSVTNHEGNQHRQSLPNPVQPAANGNGPYPQQKQFTPRNQEINPNLAVSQLIKQHQQAISHQTRNPNLQVQRSGNNYNYNYNNSNNNLNNSNGTAN